MEKPIPMEISTALRVLIGEEDVFEIRIPKTKTSGTVSGYFSDKDLAAVRVTKWDRQAPGIYVTLNPVNPALLARANNMLRHRSDVTTTDSEITCRRWLPIDFDPKRPSGISSTDSEHELALELAKQVRDWLSELGWPSPILADSGNGAHLLYRIDLPNDADSAQLIANALRAIAITFSDDRVEVDTTVSNAARIWKLYGTTSAKGDSTQQRPWRASHILALPSELHVVDPEKLRALATPLQTAREDTIVAGKLVSDIADYVESLGYKIVAGPMPFAGTGRKWLLESCPFVPEHKKPMIGMVDNRPVFRCLHASCAAHGWREFRSKIDPGYSSPTKILEELLDNPRMVGEVRTVTALSRLSYKDYTTILSKLKLNGMPGVSDLKKAVDLERKNLIEIESRGTGVPQNIYGLYLQIKNMQLDHIIPQVWYNDLDHSIRTGTVQANAERLRYEWLVSDTVIKFHEIGQVWVRGVHVQTALDRILNENRRNPMQEWLDSLVWDGVSRLQTWLSKYLDAESSQYSDAIGRKWLLSAVARAKMPGCQADHMLILEGTQGIGKSRALRIIGGPFYAEFTGVLSSAKDHASLAHAMMGKLVLELSELSSFKKAHIETLKALITNPRDTVRLPYRRDVEDYHRTCVLAGTTNEVGVKYIHDASGARRFWPVQLGKQLKVDELERDRDQLWAEAVVMYSQNEDWWSVPLSDVVGQQELRQVLINEDSWYDELRDMIFNESAVSDEYVAIYNPAARTPIAASGQDTLAILMRPNQILSIWLQKPIKDQTQFDVSRIYRILAAMGFKSRLVTVNGTRRRVMVLQQEDAPTDIWELMKSTVSRAHAMKSKLTLVSVK